MPESCALNPTAARNSQTLILQRLASVGQKPVADVLGVSEATISRMKAEGVETFTTFLGALGLKVVPAGNVCYPREHIDHLEYFARIGMKGAAPTLEFREDE